MQYYRVSVLNAALDMRRADRHPVAYVIQRTL